MKAQAAKKDEKMQAFQWSMIWNDPSSGNNGNSSLGGPGNGNIFWDDPNKPTTGLKPSVRQQNGMAKTSEPRPFEANLVNTKQKAVRLLLVFAAFIVQRNHNLICFFFSSFFKIIVLDDIEHAISCR